ncbi:hypothetical protein BH23ACT4_BH23ACT4_11210 [soil metagenome]
MAAKVPAEHRDEVKAAFWEIFDDIEAEGGDDAVAEAQRRIDRFTSRFEDRFPTAVKCLLTDRRALTTHLRFPAEHHKRIRHTNLIERTFGETRRRVKVIGRLPGETSCLTLVWAVLDRASQGWRGLPYTPAITRVLTELRHHLNPPKEDTSHHDNESVTHAA